MSVILVTASKDNNFYNFRKELILKLHEMGHELIMVCPYGRKIDYFTQLGCRFVDMDIDRRGTSVVKDLRLVIFYRKLLKREKPDIVLTYTTKCSVYCGFQCGRMNIPYIVNNAGLVESEKEASILQRILRVLYRIGFYKTKCMMYQNTRERDYVNTLLKNRVHYRDIPGSGVNLEEFTYRAYPKNDRLIFNYVARIVDFKGIKEFIECAKYIKGRYPDTRFVIYGDYDDDSYRDRMKALIEGGIIEYGGIQMDMKPYIEQANAVIHASYYEGMTNVVLEHSAMGRPCIGSDIPGVREGIEDGKTGYLFEVKNVDALIKAVEKFICLSDEERALMGKAARLKMEKEFDRNMVTDIYIEEIEQILRKCT
ncbi:glycosyltransferase [Lachnospiraceae bacterium WCA-9-b2]|uniref:Glycosyltransferase n=1 Tax=Sporofaciens musculi TaxID=2681861 RepID=A0A7X3MGV2_9FIRM|nr:glycosyltransferase family 4 protein [Sporofaciens musculi]MXP76215.1 glycosyltransferase [Sporofaciens musculi]